MRNLVGFSSMSLSLMQGGRRKENWWEELYQTQLGHIATILQVLVKLCIHIKRKEKGSDDTLRKTKQTPQHGRLSLQRDVEENVT